LKTGIKIGIVVSHIMIVAFGVSMSLKAGVGVGAWDALAQTLSLLLNIKIGTFVAIFNSTLVLVQWILLGKSFSYQRLTQVPVVIILGTVVNFVFYTLFQDLVLPNYIAQLVFYILGVVTIAYSVGVIMALDFVTFPLESLCLVIAEKTSLKFGRIRQAVDIISIVLVIILSFSFALPLAIREGTLIGIVMFGVLVGWFFERFKRMFKQMGII
jgi:uncharacterized membrane protein YczE